MDALTTLRLSKKVGILIKSNLSIFSSGLIQNAYFIHQCLLGIGIGSDFLTIDENPVPFDYKNIPLKTLKLNSPDFTISDYHTILTVSTGLTKEEYELCKANKVSVVSFICGNQFMHDIENFVMGDNGNRNTFIGKGSYSEELWLIPCYKFSLAYYETIRDKPAFIVPHLWSPCIVEDVVKIKLNKSISDLKYSIKHNTKKLTLLIAEPNISLFKNSWLPVVAAEYLHMKNNDLLDQVYAFNWPENKHSYKMADSLTLGSKLRRFSRLPMADILTFFNAEHSMPIFVSHQINNALNYLYYECLYFGFPLVHNSPDLEGCGYYYPENDLGKCAEMILYAQKHHHKNLEDYIAKGRKYLERVDPMNSSVAATWRQAIDSLLVKHV
jgi:hypothetical protein